LRDLIYFDEDNNNNQHLINFRQRKNIYSVIYLIQTYQQKPYLFEVVPHLYDIFKDLEGGLETNQYFELSLKREPK